MMDKLRCSLYVLMPILIWGLLWVGHAIIASLHLFPIHLERALISEAAGIWYHVMLIFPMIAVYSWPYRRTESISQWGLGTTIQILTLPALALAWIVSAHLGMRPSAAWVEQGAFALFYLAITVSILGVVRLVVNLQQTV